MRSLGLVGQANKLTKDANLAFIDQIINVESHWKLRTWKKLVKDEHDKTNKTHVFIYILFNIS